MLVQADGDDGNEVDPADMQEIVRLEDAVRGLEEVEVNEAVREEGGAVEEGEAAEHLTEHLITPGGH